MITLSQCFETAFWLFGKLWPALGAAIVAGGAFVLVLFLCELWEVCTNFYYDGSDTYRDRDYDDEE